MLNSTCVSITVLQIFPPPGWPLQSLGTGPCVYLQQCPISKVRTSRLTYAYPSSWSFPYLGFPISENNSSFHPGAHAISLGNCPTFFTSLSNHPLLCPVHSAFWTSLMPISFSPYPSHPPLSTETLIGAAIFSCLSCGTTKNFPVGPRSPELHLILCSPYSSQKSSSHSWYCTSPPYPSLDKTNLNLFQSSWKSQQLPWPKLLRK